MICKHCGEPEEASTHDIQWCDGHYCEFEPEKVSAERCMMDYDHRCPTDVLCECYCHAK